jgi:ATP-dependent Zn protease
LRYVVNFELTIAPCTGQTRSNSFQLSYRRSDAAFFSRQQITNTIVRYRVKTEHMKGNKMSDAPSFIGVVVSWLPMILLVAVFIWYSRKVLGQGGRVSWSDYMEQHIAETKRHNAILEEILHELKNGRARAGVSDNPTSS